MLRIKRLKSTTFSYLVTQRHTVLYDDIDTSMIFCANSPSHLMLVQADCDENGDDRIQIEQVNRTNAFVPSGRVTHAVYGGLRTMTCAGCHISGPTWKVATVKWLRLFAAAIPANQTLWPRRFTLPPLKNRICQSNYGDCEVRCHNYIQHH